MTRYELTRAWIKKHPKRIKELRKRDYLKHRDVRVVNMRKSYPTNSVKPSYRYARLAARCKYSGKEFNLSIKDYVEIIRQPCFYCLSSLLNEKGVSLDRKDNQKGYTLDNVLPCCGTCNRVRSDKLTVDEMIVAMRAITAFRATTQRTILNG